MLLRVLKLLLLLLRGAKLLLLLRVQLLLLLMLLRVNLLVRLLLVMLLLLLLQLLLLLLLLLLKLLLMLLLLKLLLLLQMMLLLLLLKLLLKLLVRLSLLLTGLLGQRRRRGLGFHLNLTKFRGWLSLLGLGPLLRGLLSMVLVESLSRLIQRMGRMSQVLRVHLLLLLGMV
jgi:hypothetical protein